MELNQAEVLNVEKVSKEATELQIYRTQRTATYVRWRRHWRNRLDLQRRHAWNLISKKSRLLEAVVTELDNACRARSLQPSPCLRQRWAR